MSAGGVPAICYVVSTLERCGPTTQLFNLVRGLDPRRFRPRVVTLSPEGADTAARDFAGAGIDVVTLGLGRVAGSILATGALRRLLGQGAGPAVLHSTGVRADSVTEGADPAIPRIATVRNFPQIDYPLAYGRFAGGWLARRQIAALKRKTVAVCVSRAVETNLRDLGVRATTVIRNGVDVSAFRPADASEKTRLRDQVGLPRDGVIWVAAGALVARKNPRFILDAFNSLPGGPGGRHLVLLGDGDLRDDLRRRSSGAPNVHMLGSVSSVADYLRASDIFVSASIGEGLPNAVLEALACGLPALLSDIPPHRELQDLAPRSVELFPAGDTSSLFAAEGRLRQRDARAGATLLPRELTSGAMAEAYQALYERLVRDRR